MESYIQQGDCLLLMETIPDKSIDMILCDLPYGLTQNPYDKPIPFEKLWANYKRIIKPNGVIALFGQGQFFIDLVESNRKWYRYDIVWDKVLTSGFLNAKRMPLRRHEQVAVFYQKLPTYNPQFSEGQPLHGRGKTYVNKPIKNHNYGKFKNTEDDRKGSTEKYPTSIIRESKAHPSKAIHPTEKPVKLLEYLIKTYTNEGEIVLDNCMGCGSTVIACMRTKRKYIGFELAEEYFLTAQERIIKENMKGG